MVADVLVGWRDTLLDRLVGLRPGEVLNTGSNRPTAKSAVGVSADLKRAVNALKAAAGDSSGDRLGYAQLRQSPAYEEYRTVCTSSLRGIDLTALATLEERLAFWINLYNATVIDAVIAFGVRTSVAEGLAGRLAFFRRAAYAVGGYRFSCDDIEHGILRGNHGHPYIPGPQFGPSDPRRPLVISPPDVRCHFALNCGSRSCPPIGVYDAERIDSQLDLATRHFVGTDVVVDRARNTLRLSQLFRWFAGDFGGRPGMTRFLLRYLPEAEDRQWLAARRGVRLAYHPYDWGLNAA